MTTNRAEVVYFNSSDNVFVLLNSNLSEVGERIEAPDTFQDFICHASFPDRLFLSTGQEYYIFNFDTLVCYQLRRDIDAFENYYTAVPMYDSVILSNDKNLNVLGFREDAAYSLYQTEFNSIRTITVVDENRFCVLTEQDMYMCNIRTQKKNLMTTPNLVFETLDYFYESNMVGITDTNIAVIFDMDSLKIVEEVYGVKGFKKCNEYLVVFGGDKVNVLNATRNFTSISLLDESFYCIETFSTKKLYIATKEEQRVYSLADGTLLAKADNRYFNIDSITWNDCLYLMASTRGLYHRNFFFLYSGADIFTQIKNGYGGPDSFLWPRGKRIPKKPDLRRLLQRSLWKPDAIIINK
jgi:hypothetical protein